MAGPEGSTRQIRQISHGVENPHNPYLLTSIEEENQIAPMPG
ncbi:Uncharacterised protein [Pannonibacter phragmitetus]|uniref:Uncharacterized protein n=1 Tax=Pannonibacter phragmitetus TaxID=121719 RepID=A0A378ZS36_9HYPH|nr:Uncharacterised protein [Pannonibacter phragmitetus]